MFSSNNIQSRTNSTRIPIEQKSGNMTIPCISRDPYSIPELYYRNLELSNVSIMNNHSAVAYDITKGFILNTSILKNPKGLYFCKEHNSAYTINSESIIMRFEIFSRKGRRFRKYYSTLRFLN